MNRIIAFLRNPTRIFNAVSLSVGLVGMILAIYYRPTKPAHVNAILATDLDMLALPKSWGLPLRYVWADTLDAKTSQIELQKLRLSTIIITNTGDQALEWDRTFGGPITLSIGGDGKLLHVEHVHADSVLASEPCKIAIQPDWKSFTVTTRFLNPHEGLALLVSHTGDAGAISIDGSAIGQGNLELSTPANVPAYWTRGDVQSAIWYWSIIYWACVITRSKRFCRMLRLGPTSGDTHVESPLALSMAMTVTLVPILIILYFTAPRSQLSPILTLMLLSLWIFTWRIAQMRIREQNQKRCPITSDG